MDLWTYGYPKTDGIGAANRPWRSSFCIRPPTRRSICESKSGLTNAPLIADDINCGQLADVLSSSDTLDVGSRAKNLF